MKINFNTTRGFTLIEMLVSVAIFTLVMVMALGALLAMSASDRKAQALKSVINNLNFVLEDMSRTIRTGTNYHCDVTTGTITSPQNCSPTGSNSISFLSASGVQTYYRLDSANANICNQTGTIGCIEISTDGVNWSALTSPEVVVKDFSGLVPASYLFYVLGSLQGDGIQPRVVMTLSADVVTSVSKNGVMSTNLHLQTTVTQRLYDQ